MKKNYYYLLVVLLIFVQTGGIYSQSWKELYDSAKVLKDKNNFSLAIDIGKSALEKAKSEFGTGSENYALSNFTLGELYLSILDYKNSLEYLEKSVELFKELYPESEFPEGHPYLSNSLFVIAGLYNNIENFDKAEESYTEALQISKRLYSKEKYPRGHIYLLMIINSFASFYNSNEKLDEAEKLYIEALSMARDLFPKAEFAGGHSYLASMINNLAFFYKSHERLTEAEKLYRESLEMTRNLNPVQKFPDGSPNLIVSINNLASLYKLQEKTDDAELLYRESLTISRKLFTKDKFPFGHPYLSWCLSNMGLICKSRGNYSESELLYSEALTICRKFIPTDNSYDGQQDLILSLNNLGLLYKEQGRYEEAEKLYIESLDISRKLYNQVKFPKGHPNLAMNLNNLASLYKNQKRMTEAEFLFNEALEMNRKLYNESKYPDGHPGLANTLNNLGNIYFATGRFTDAEKMYKEGLSMFRKLYNIQKFTEGHPGIATSLNNIGALYWAQGRIKEAETSYIEALEMRKKLYPKTIFPSGHPDLALSYKNLASLYQVEDRLSESEALYKEAFRIFKDFYLSNIAFLSETEREQYWNTIDYHFEIFYSFAIKRMNQNPEILSIMNDNILFLKGMQLNLSRKLRESISLSKDNHLKNLYDNWIKTREYLNTLYSLTSSDLKKLNINIDSIENSSNNFEKELAKKSNLFDKTINQLFSWRDLKDEIQPDEAVVEIVKFNWFNKDWTDTVYYAALIITTETIDNPKLVLFTNGNEMEKNFFPAYENMIYFKLDGNIEDFYGIFWKPIAEELKGKNKILISVDGVYNKINLNTLFNQSTGKYLLNEIDITLMTSTKGLIDRNNRKYSLKNAALFGYPKYNMDKNEYETRLVSISNERNIDIGRNSVEIENLRNIKLVELKGTKKEVEKIDSMLEANGWTSKEYLWENAFEEYVKSVRSPRVLHLSTHGYFLSDEDISLLYDSNSTNKKVLGLELSSVDRDPMLRSMLFFNGAENYIESEIPNSGTDNGILTAKEAMFINLDSTELVVLSACATGLGKIKNGEGVFGLQRAFILAGTEKLIMSLWPVPDKQTQEFMVLFYEKWLSGQTKENAFRTAQQELKNKYGKPYFWGAFVMIGK